MTVLCICVTVCVGSKFSRNFHPLTATTERLQSQKEIFLVSVELNFSRLFFSFLLISCVSALSIFFLIQAPVVFGIHLLLSRNKWFFFLK